MGKRFFAIFSRGVKVSKSGNRLVFENSAKRISVLLKELHGVLVFGKASFSGDALNLLLRENVPLFFLSRFGRIKGFLLSEVVGSNYNTRLEQYNLFLTKRLEVARFFVIKKLDAIEKTFLIDLSPEKLAAKGAEDLDTLRGIEGRASVKMFEEVKKELEKSEFTFRGRDYRPPPDEVNALLSLSYTMVYLTALPVVVALGYDPYISFLHSKRGTHAAFCSDVMEPIRPFITQTLVSEIVRGNFKRKDFQRNPQGGYYLKEEALAKFLTWYENQTEEVLKRLSQTLAEFATLSEELK
jgi:CRISPR-associated protein Cas1